MRQQTIKLAVIFATLLSCVLSVQAENYNYYWKGGSGNYFTQSNWELSDGTAAPVALDSSGNAITAYVQVSGSSVTFDYSILGAAVRSLTIGGGSGSASVTRNSNSSLTIDSGKFISVLSNGTLTVQNDTKINAGGTLTVDGGTYNQTGMTISGTFDYTSGANFVNNNTITLNDGGSFNLAGSGQFRMSSASAIMNIQGGTATIDNISYIGVTANGVINQSGGNATFNKSLVFGWGAGNGTYNLSGGTLTTTDNAGLWCSKTTGFNTFNMTGGTANFNKAGNSFAVGLYDDGTGTQWTPRSVANVFNLYSGTVNAANTFAIQYNGTLFVAKNGEDGGDGVLNAKAITLTNTGNLNMSSGTINVGEGGITSSDGAYSITLSGGTFGTKGSNWSSALNAGISSNAVTFAPETGKTITWSGILSGAGGVTKSGAGTLVLTADNTYTGATTVSAGGLKMTGGAVAVDGPITVANGATLEFNVASGPEKTLQVGTTNKVTGAGQIFKTGDGTLKIDAAENCFEADSLTVVSGRLDMKEYLKGKLNLKNGTVFSPGNSIGKLTVDGDLTLGEAGGGDEAKIIMEISGVTVDENDQLIVTGDLDFANGKVYLELGESSSLAQGESFAVLFSAGNKDAFKSNLISDYVSAPAYFTNLAYVPYTGDQYVITGTLNYDAVPEPATWALLLFGAAGLMFWRKRK